MNKLKNLVVLLLVLLLTSQSTLSLAQPSSRFPDSITMYQGTERYQGFDLVGFTDLLRMDLDLGEAVTRARLLEQQVEHFGIQIESYTLSISLLEDDLQEMTQDRDRISTMWEEQNLALHECENKPRLMSVAGWVTAAILGVVLGGTIIGVRVGR